MINTILIFGASGFIGSHVVAKLLKKKFSIVIVIKKSINDTWRIKKFFHKIKVYDLDIDPLEKIYRENKIDAVINFITNYGRAKNSLPSQIIDVNLTLALKIIEGACNARVPYYMNIDSSLHPNVNIYSFSKNTLKTIFKKWFSDKINIFNVQLQYVFGEHDDTSKFLPYAISKLKTNETLNMTNGEQELDFIYVKDCADAINYILQNHLLFTNKFEEFQIGSGKTISLKKFIEIVKMDLHSTSIIHYGNIPYRNNEQMHSVADLSNLHGWKPKYEIKNINFQNF